LERELDLKNLLIATDDTIMGELKRKNLTGYPYAYLNFTEIIGVKDQVSTRYIQRLGIRTANSEATKATSSKGFIFPVNLSMELKYVDEDPMRILLMAEALTILSMIGGLSFSINSGSLDLVVRVEIPENTSIPIASAEAANAPGGTEVSVNMIIHTYAGFFKDVSAVQASTPTQSFTITKL
jgi:hypothetical protein